MTHDNSDLEDKLQQLETELTAAIKREDYLAAAELRDEMNKLVAAASQKDPAQDKDDFESKITTLEREKLHLQDRLRRLGADFDNFQKRNRRDRERWAQESTRELLVDFLPAFDNLDSVLDSLNTIEVPKSLKEGLDLVKKTFVDTLEKYGTAIIKPRVGDKFDPELHMAISILYDDKIEEEAVAQVIRCGYRIGEIIVRPAEVIVKKNSE